MTWGFKTCGPNEAMVVSGCFYGKPHLISGGRIFVLPIIQRIDRISLNIMTLKIESPRIYTQLGVPITVTGVAQVKIQSSNKEMLATACEQFLGRSVHQIMDVAKETLEGHQRAIMGNMTVEEIYMDRKKFSKHVFEVASSDLVNMGISVVSYTLKDIHDDEGYLKSLGLARTAQVKRDGRIGEAEAQRDAGMKQAKAEETQVSSKLANQTKIAQAERDFQLKKAEFDKEVETKKAQSQLAYNLQAAVTKQQIKEEEMQIKVIERAQQVKLQELEIVRRDRELEAKVRKPAEAEAYRIQKSAEAERLRIIKEAEGEAETIRLNGEARAYAIDAMAKAEAEQLEKKAEAWREYGNAAKLEMFLSVLPKLAAEVAAPLSSCHKITMVSSGSGDLGAHKITGEVISIMETLPNLVRGMTGFDMAKNMTVRAT